MCEQKPNVSALQVTFLSPGDPIKCFSQYILNLCCCTACWIKLDPIPTQMIDLLETSSWRLAPLLQTPRPSHLLFNSISHCRSS
jgi:hypothetical protein